MNKEEILSELKRLAKENGGKAPGFQRFSSETGLRKADWYPNLWLRWGDVISEAGYDSNEFISAYNADYLIKKYIDLIRELGHFPIEGELRIKSKSDENFPSHSGFSQLGGKQDRIEKIIKHCESKEEFSDIVTICKEVSKSSQKNEDSSSSSKCIGYVYLIKHGNRNEYKIGMTNNPIRREGELRIELPEKVKPIHYIETDDPYGIEKYWHNRFSIKRKEGEWFSLSSNDVRAFKRWKRIY
jgi:hypothetical protein